MGYAGDDACTTPRHYSTRRARKNAQARESAGASDEICARRVNSRARVPEFFIKLREKPRGRVSEGTEFGTKFWEAVFSSRSYFLDVCVLFVFLDGNDRQYDSTINNTSSP